MTLYRLAKNFDFVACSKLLEGGEDEGSKFKFPTIVAEREGEIIGFIGTIDTDKAIVAGPLAFNGVTNPAFVAIRLIEAYELTLRQIGIPQYIFALRHKDENLKKHIEQFPDYQAFHYGQSLVWYRRELK